MWQEVKLTALDIKQYPKKPLEGFFLGTREINTSFGESLVHDFQKADGSTISVYGFTSLNCKLAIIETGTLVQITYTGTENIKTKYGMKDVHQCVVKQDPKSKIEVNRVPKENGNGNGNTAPDTKNKDADDLPF